MKGRFYKMALLLCILMIVEAGSAASEPLTAQLVQAYSALTISAFKIEGKAKFSKEKARRLAQIHEGMKLADIDPEAVLERFQALGLFSEIGLDAELSEDSAVVTLTLREKMTLLPIPMIMASESKQSYGAMVMDYDFLGSGHNLTLGGAYSSDNTWMAMLGTGTMPTPGTVGYQVLLSCKDGEQQTQWVDGDSYRSWKALGLSSMASASMPLDQLLSLQASGRVNYSKALDDDTAYNAPENSLWLSPSVGLSLNDQQHEDFFSSGFRAGLTFSPGFDVWQGDSYLSLSASAGLGLPLFGKGALQLSGSGELSNRPDSALTSVVGSRILMGKTVQATSYAEAAATLDYPVLEGKALIMTLGAFYEGGVVREGIEANRQTDFFHGPGLGLRVYLKKIAIQALGFDIDYDVISKTTNFGFAFGFSR
jgi:outer membrane protein assembly factor BamA